MLAALLVSIGLGSLAVLQASLNKQMAAQWGLAPTIVLNGAIVIILAIFFFAYANFGGKSELLRDGVDVVQIRWWWLLPGLFGFLLIVGLPWATARVGALQVFVGVVAAQMVTSIVWDALVEKIPASGVRIAGAGLAVVGVVLASWE